MIMPAASTAHSGQKNETKQTNNPLHGPTRENENNHTVTDLTRICAHVAQITTTTTTKSIISEAKTQ